MKKRVWQLVLAATMAISVPAYASEIPMVKIVEADTIRIQEVLEAVEYGVVLKSDGTVWKLPYTLKKIEGKLETEAVELIQMVNLQDVIAISSSGEHQLALKSDGTVWVWGWESYGEGYAIPEPIQVEGLTDVVSISANLNLAVKKDGTVWTFSPHEGKEKLQQIQGLKDIVSVDSGHGSYYALALDKNGQVWSWGYNSFGELGHGEVGVRYESEAPDKVKNLTNIKKIDAGAIANMALKEDGTVWVWGSNQDYISGNDKESTETLYTEPVQVEGLVDVVDIEVGRVHQFVRKVDGTLLVWGSNDSGALGNGTVDWEASQKTPIQVANLPLIQDMSIGGFNYDMGLMPGRSLVLDVNGDMWIWGAYLNQDEELEDTTLSLPTKINIK